MRDPAEFAGFLERLGATVRPPAGEKPSWRPFLCLLADRFGVEGARLLRADEPTTLRLETEIGSPWPEGHGALSLARDHAYEALFKRAEATAEAGLLAVPLRVAERVGGAVLMWRPEPFSEQELGEARVACATVAAALEAHEAARRMGTRRAELEAVHASMVDGVVVVDRRGYLSSFNEAFKRITEQDSLELYGLRWFQLIEPRNHPSLPSGEVLEAFLDALIMGEPYVATGVPAFLKVPDGRRVPVAVGMATVVEEGKATGGVLNVRDATLESQLERQKDDFIATVSHELKTPLTTISGFVELLQAHDLPRGEQLPLFDLILDEGQRLNRMIRDLLDLSKIQSGLLTLHYEKAVLARVVERAAAPLARRHAATHALELDIQPAGGTLVADQDRLVQILVNLLGNAFKYSPAGGTVTLRARKRGGWWTIAVSDQGIGIPAEAMKRLFGRFFRVKEDQSTGSGLGLFITKNLVACHGGSIEATSVEGRGSTFTFRLPASPRQLEATVPAAGAPAIEAF